MARTPAAPPARDLHVLSLATLYPDTSRPNFGLFVERSLRSLSRQPGIKLTVVAPIGIPPWPLSRHPRYAALRDLPTKEVLNGVTVLRPRFLLLPRVGGALNPTLIARAVLPIARKLKRTGKLDIIDAQFFYPDGPATMVLASLLNLPFSIKARGADISYWGHRPGTAAKVRRAADAATGLLAVSSAMRDDMAALGIDAGKVRVHYTGVDRARFHPGDRAAARAKWRERLGITGPLIVTVGALIPRKGQELVIGALPDLPGVHYAMAGAGDAEGAYRALASDKGVADRVHILGPVANADLPDLYRAADVVVMPSVSEGLANAWVEALVCGTPIVISDAGGAAELVTSDVAGRIVPRTSKAIADAVRAILSAPPSPDAVAATLNGRFDWDRNGAELAAHLRALLAGR